MPAAIAAIVALQAPDPARAECSLGRVARFPVTMEGLRPNVPVTINGKPAMFLVDSGAFFSFMSAAKAAEYDLPLKSMPDGFYVSGVGGSANVRVATVKSFGVANATLKNVEFLVGGSDVGSGLIGLNLLSAYDTEYDLANGTVDLVLAKNCAKANLAHWAGEKSISVLDLLPGDNSKFDHIYARGQINGKDVRVMFDTGAATTVLLRPAAERLGIDLSAPGVVSSYDMGGIGSKRRQSWIVKLASFSISGEEIRNTPIRVIDDSGSGIPADVVLGADFFLAHHILVARSQQRIYLTYNGGPVFSLTTEGETGKTTTRAENMGGAEKTAAPVDAADFARRGAAKLTRGDTAGAIADLSEAIRLDPKSAQYYRDRSRAYAESNNAAAAERDIDAAIALQPQDPQLLIARAFQRVGRHDTAGALADADAAQKLMTPGSLDNLGLILLFERLDLPERNIALLDAIIALHKNDSSLGGLLNSRCWARGLANVELDKALADCNAAIKRDGPKPHILDSRALVRVRQKDYAAAIADYDAALKAQPDLAGSLYMRGWVERATGDRAKGATDMAAAKAIDPGVASRFQPYGLGE
jgi:predicted aspartyl protease/tetratricopeptide (TPR) repeat protein